MLERLSTRCGRLSIIPAVLCALLSARAGATSPPSDRSGEAKRTADGALADLGRLMERVQTLYREKKPAEAVEATRQMLALVRKQPNARELLPSALNWSAVTAKNAEDWPHAESLHKEKLAAQIELRGAEHWESIDARLELDDVRKLAAMNPTQRRELKQSDAGLEQAAALSAQGKHAEAAKAANDSALLAERIWGKKHRKTADSRLFSGYFAGLAGDLDAAQARYGEVIAIRKGVLGTRHPEYVAGLEHLAKVYFDRRDFEKAEPLYAEAVSSRRQYFDAKDPEYARSLSRLGAIYSEKGSYARAVPLVVEALKIRKEVLGTKHADYALSLNNAATLYANLSDYARAEPLLVEACTVRKELQGAKHPDYASSLSNLAALYVTMGDSTRAEPLYAEARQVRKDAFGVKHPDYAASLNNSAELYLGNGDIARAEPLFLEAHAIVREVLGTRHPNYAVIVSNLGALYSKKGDYARAERHYLDALALRKAILGISHPSYAISLNNLASLRETMGDYERAEPLHLEAVRIRKEVLGPKHPSYATSLNNLASLYEAMGDGSRAEPLYVESLKICKDALGTKHPTYSTGLNNLALLYKNKGDYARAAPLYVEALEVQKHVAGTKHPNYAASLNNLAMLYASMGDYARATPLCVEALAITKDVFGSKHRDYASSLNNLAMLYLATGATKLAEPLLVEALAIRKDILGTKHPDYAVCLGNLAELYSSQEKYQAAESLLLEAVAVRRDALGEKHPDYARSVNNLAALCVMQGQYAKAEPLYIEVRNVFKEALGATHPDYAVCLSNLGVLYFSMGDFARAEPLIREAAIVSRSSLDATARVQSERQQLAMGRSLRHELDSYISLGVRSGEFARAIFSQVLSWKGATLVRQRRMRLIAGDPAVGILFSQLQRTAVQLASLSRTSPQRSDARAAWNAKLAELARRKENLEAELSAKSAPFRDANKPIMIDELVAGLPNDAVLVDYLEFDRYLPPTAKGLKPTRERQLVAFIVRPSIDENEQVRMVSLGPVAPIATAIDVWRNSFGMGPEGQVAGRTLRAAVWQPLLEYIADPKMILVSTDGALGRLSLGALPGKEPDTYLLEDHRMALLPVPQLLPTLMTGKSSRVLSRDLLLLGNVDYGAEPAERPEPNLPGAQVDLFRSAGGDVSDKPLKQLPETNIEIVMIRNKLAEVVAKRGAKQEPRVEVLQGSGATVAEFRRLAPECRYLHLATHGLFAPPSVKSAERSASTDASRSGEWTRLATHDAQLVGFAPGLLSGLAFAGANEPPQADQEDGILTSEEIATMPLEGVRLVVLSACDTGLGATAGGEGLLGVQRAFQVAGAGTTIATLWAVDDLATRMIMERFYVNFWERGLSRLDALRDAQLYVLNNPDKLRGGTVVESNAPSKLRSNPQLWAAFILSGDWR